MQGLHVFAAKGFCQVDWVCWSSENSSYIYWTFLSSEVGIQRNYLMDLEYKHSKYTFKLTYPLVLGYFELL